MAAIVNDIADVDGFLVRAGAADALQCVQHGHGGLQIHILRSHDGAGGILRVFQNFVDALPHIRVGVLQNPLDHIGGHFLHDVNRIVQIQLVQHFFQFRVGKALDQQLLLVAFQLHEYLGGLLLGQQAEQQGQGLFVVQVVGQNGNVRRLHGQQEVPQLCISFSVHQILNFFDQFPTVFHFKHSVTSFPGLPPGISAWCGAK